MNSTASGRPPTVAGSEGGSKVAAEADSSSHVAPDMDKAAAWDAGEVGGFEAYLLAEEDKEGTAAADTYRTVRGGKLLLGRHY